jgi:hypothetical protein
VLSNCVLVANVASSLSSFGGGAFQGTLNNCILLRNSAGSDFGQAGGGVFGATLNNCTVVGNSARWRAGGAARSVLNNCIVYFNTAERFANHFSSTFNYSCTTPLPAEATGPGPVPSLAGDFHNISVPPGFVDWEGGDLRLRPDSPCINAGHNAFAPPSRDLEGNPRVAGGTVDMGAYEFAAPSSEISYAWLQRYALPIDGSADFADPDGDKMNNWQEWRSGIDPTNALSVLRLLPPLRAGSGVWVRWHSVAGKRYFLERSTHLGPSGGFMPLITNISAQSDLTTYADPGLSSETFFYRVRVNP